jgi:predicted N-acetyltransferase YhbS
MDITYRFLDPRSESDICQWLNLHSVCFQDEITRDLWDHIHMADPFYNKTKPLILVAEADKKIVGSVSLIPSPIQEHRNNILNLYHSLLVCKAMVHPDYQKKGIFGNLLKKSIESAESEGYDLLITVSDNPYSYKSFIRTGFNDITAMRWATVYLSIDTQISHYIDTLKLPWPVKKIPLSSCSLFYSQLTTPGDHSLQIKTGDISEFIEQISNFNISNQSEREMYGIRTNHFIHWRFFRENACFKCITLWNGEKMLGYLVIQCKEGGGNAFIVDISLSNENLPLISILVKETQKYLKKNNFQRLSIYMMEKNSNLLKFFSYWNGFIKQSSKTGKLKESRFLSRTINKNFTKTSFSDKNNWNLKSVDTCLFLS